MWGVLCGVLYLWLECVLQSVRCSEGLGVLWG